MLNKYIIISRTNQMSKRLFDRFVSKIDILQNVVGLYGPNRTINLKDGCVFIFVSEIEFYDNHYDSLRAIFMPDLEFENKFLKED